MKSKLRYGKLRKLYNIVSHDEELQNLLIAISCFIIIGCIAIICLIGG